VHEPPGYKCPFCSLLRGVETERNRLDDIVWRDELTTAFISPKWWPENPGAAIVIPNEHVENLYGITVDVLGAVGATTKRVACAMRDAYRCDGTSTRQHNEPGANQDVWHFHVHVFPRRRGDDLYARDAEAAWVGPAERRDWAERLRTRLSK
jgi:histidine triad (HIT) family protein